MSVTRSCVGSDSAALAASIAAAALASTLIVAGTYATTLSQRPDVVAFAAAPAELPAPAPPPPAAPGEMARVEPPAVVAAAAPAVPAPRRTPQRRPGRATITPVAGARARATAPTLSWEARRGAAALDLISYPWQELGWQITFHAARNGVLGIASHSERRIRMYVRSSHSDRLLAFSVAHEIGHAVDFELGTPASHARWLELRGIDPDTPWYGCEGCADLETPAGDFAEVFAVWQVGPVDYRSRMAPMPTGEEMDMLAGELNAGPPRR